MFAAVKMSCEQVFAKRGIRLLDSDIAYIFLLSGSSRSFGNS
jgi:hypothetical protein